MERKHIITISGKPGSGKSSTADRVAEMLGYTRYSAGDMARRIVEEMDITLAEYNRRAESDHSLDHRVDDSLRDLRDKTDIVIDSRLGFYWIPESFKVYLDLDMDVATARIYKDAVSNANRARGGGTAKSVREITQQVRSRMQNERFRFRSLYNVDPYNTTHFDLIVDTSRQSPQSVALAVFDTYKAWLRAETWKQVRNSVPMGYSLD